MSVIDKRFYLNQQQIEPTIVQQVESATKHSHRCGYSGPNKGSNSRTNCLEPATRITITQSPQQQLLDTSLQPTILKSWREGKTN